MLPQSAKLRCRGGGTGASITRTFLQSASILSELRSLHLHAPPLWVEPHLEFHVLHERPHDILPLVSEWRVSVRWAADSAHLDLTALA